MHKFLLLISLVCSSAFAQPPRAMLDLINRTYDPRISVTETEVTTLLEVCHRTNVELTAQDPVTLKPGKVKLTMFVRKFSEDKAPDLKTVIVMPPTGGVNALDWSYAALLCSNNFRVAVITNWDFDTFNEIDMGMHDRGALRALAAVRHSIEYLKPRRPNQLGILGTSVGAISAALVTGFEPRVSAAALIVGGAGLSEIIAQSDESHLAALRKARMEHFKFESLGSYQSALSQNIKIEPLDFAGYSGPKKVWMMIATKDTTVPTANQWKLFKAFGSQSGSLTFGGNHLETILHTSAVNGLTIVGYFKSVLQ
jgi:dienelactone hydrolase